MKLGTLRDGTRDGALIVVSKDLSRYCSAQQIASDLQNALDRWDEVAGSLEELASALECGTQASQPLMPDRLHAPLPRAYEWLDGSVFINHILLLRKSRGAEPPPGLEIHPLVYQGGSGVLLGPTEDIPLVDPDWGLDYEAEVVVILGDTPRGTTAEQAQNCVRLITLCNDVSLRGLTAPELKKGFGFVQSKPASAFGPLAVTPDELGDAWQRGRVHLRLQSRLNGKTMGDPEAGPEMHFSFFDLIAHIAKTRGFTAGTLLGSGTVSNSDPKRGVSCLAEQRTREILAGSSAQTPFLKVGDHVEIEMLDATGASVFGCIDQRVV